jgi:alpha-aminoadipate/glutamate carrier protein LysW
MAVNCPECDSTIDVDEMDVEVGDELSCSECGALLRVFSDSPLELELADGDTDEDDDDDEEDEDDEESDEFDDDDEENEDEIDE